MANLDSKTNDSFIHFNKSIYKITSNDHMIIMIDKLCKRILGYPEILGRIIKGFIKEAEDVSLEEIIELIKGKKDQEREFLFPTAK